MIRSVLLLLLMPVAARAQLVLFAANGAAETQVGASYNMGQIALGGSMDLVLRARNIGASAIQVTVLSLSGSGFTIVNTSSIPYTVGPGAFMAIDVHFAAGAPGSYSATLHVNSISLLLLAGSFAAPANALALFTANGTTETPVGASYNLGQVPAGGFEDVVIRARNTGVSAIQVTVLSLSGTGFTVVNTSSIPVTIAPGNFMPIDVHFTAGTPGSYSANLLVNAIPLLIVAVSVPTPTLTVVAGCTGPDSSTGTIDFGKTPSGQTVTCSVSLQNRFSQSLTVAAIAVSGMGFRIPQAVSTPLTLAPGGTAGFTIVFAPTTAAVYTGLLTVDSQSFLLTGTSFNPPLPTPILGFDSNMPASAQQITLTMSLPTPAPSSASGSVNLLFQPDTSLVTGDPGVVFIATGATSVSFNILPGDTQIKLGGQAGAVFQTGTTSGRITFSVSINTTLSGDPTVRLIIPPAPIAIETASAVARAGALDVQVSGFDNTYTAGSMAFTFYDIAGKTITPGAIHADFTSEFRNYFSSAQAGSAFQMLVTFPVSGQANQVGAVDLQMNNTSGATTVSHLIFINDTGQCITVSSSLIVCPHA